MTTPSPDAEATARIDSDLGYTPYPRGPKSQFAPGTIIAGRYRIGGVLGSGGMGEVYRADDTKLDQAVALKFLPARLARDPILLARLHDEVRLGRQIAHPNVCRIYDIVDWETSHFVAMEFVDGEDLSRLLKRIGRLAHDKAVDIARGIAAGLLAAHGKGILHRDLKPANIIIDSHGEARIMDFGLALAAGEDDGTISGTPAYMAPEQIEGRPATIQSDLYALGLVMYELFTGKRAHSARTLPERARDISSEITTPSNVIRDLDPAVERIILRCLSNEPSQRPRSAREVIEALPGGDPLAAAMAAGETPSPGMVANAGTEGSLSRIAAWSLLGAIALLFGLYLLVREQQSVARHMPAPRSPQVLRDRAEELLHAFGVHAPGRPVAMMRRQLAYMVWSAGSAKSWRNGPSPFVYRLVYGSTGEGGNAADDSMATAPGRSTIELDSRGRLVHLLAPPLPRGWKKRALDPNAVLRAAGLDPSKMKPAPITFAPPAPFDHYLAWTGTYPGDSTPIRAELASWHGTPTFFRVSGEWDLGGTPDMAFETRSAGFYLRVIALILLATTAMLAWRNLRLRRGDRQGAGRLALVIFIVSLITELLDRGVGQSLRDGMTLVFRSVSTAIALAAIGYMGYIAIEPIVRRRWPSQLISWTRLMTGRWRDPMVGRDVLVGVIAGLFHTLFAAGTGTLAAILAEKDAAGDLQGIYRFTDMRTAGAAMTAIVRSALVQSFAIMGVLALLLIVLRRRGLAAAALFALFLTAYIFAIAGQWGLLPIVMLIAVMQTWLITRYGLLAYVASAAAFQWTFHLPPMGAPWATPFVVVPFGVTILLALAAFYTSLGGQSPFSASLLDE